jgi:hypothetical protein
LTFPPPPYHPRWFSSQIRRQAEWPDKRIAVQQKKLRAPKSPTSKPSDNQKIGTTLQSKAVEHCNFLAGVFELLNTAQRASARIFNTLMTTTC